MDDEMNGAPQPASYIMLRAEIGSSQFEITTENCDPVQLFGAAKVLELIGMEAFADMRAASIASSRRIVTPGNQKPILVGREH